MLPISSHKYICLCPTVGDLTCRGLKLHPAQLHSWPTGASRCDMICHCNSNEGKTKARQTDVATTTLYHASSSVRYVTAPACRACAVSNVSRLRCTYHHPPTACTTHSTHEGVQTALQLGLKPHNRTNCSTSWIPHIPTTRHS